MNDDIIQDLKQFITTTTSKATAGLASKDDLSHAVAGLTTKVDDIDLKLTAVADALTERFDEHEQRLTRLEHHTA